MGRYINLHLFVFIIIMITETVVYFTYHICARYDSNNFDDVKLIKSCYHFIVRTSYMGYNASNNVDSIYYHFVVCMGLP